MNKNLENKKLKIVVIWPYSGLVSIYRKYIEEIAKQNTETWLIIPEYWPFEPEKIKLKDYFFKNFKKITFEGFVDEKLNIIKMKVFLPGKVAHFYFGLNKILNEIKPNIIYSGLELFQLSAAQIVRWRNKFSKKTKLIFEPCENLDKSFNHKHEYLIYKYVLKNSDGLVTMTSEIANLATKRGYKGPIELIGEAADPIKFKRYNSSALRKKLGLQGFVVGYCGRMTEAKGLLILVEAFSKVRKKTGKKMTLMVIGGGGEDFKKKVIEKAEKFKVLQNIVFVGQVNGNKLPKYLSCFDVGVAPSLTTPSWKEQFGRFTSEFILCGVPIIGSSSSTTDEVLGKDAIMYPEKDSNALAEKIEVLMKNSDIGKRLVKFGRKRVLEGFTNEKLAKKFVKFAEKILYS